MAAKDKEEKKNPVIKVEEIEEETSASEEKEPEKTGEKDVEKEEEKDKEKRQFKEEENLLKNKVETPIVSSFSQLDSKSNSSSDTKEKTEDSENEKTDDSETEDKTVEDATHEENKENGNSEAENKEQISSDEVKEWLKDVRPDTTKENDKKRGPGGKIFLIALTIFILGAIVGGVLYFQKGVSQPPTEEATPTEAPKETETPTATPTKAETDLSTITIDVLNGSGIAGEAGKIKDLLTDAGFTANNIETGNADSYDYQEVSVSVKGDVSSDVIEAIEKSLSDSYTVEISKDNLGTDSEYDVEVIVGK